MQDFYSFSFFYFAFLLSNYLFVSVASPGLYLICFSRCVYVCSSPFSDGEAFIGKCYSGIVANILCHFSTRTVKCCSIELISSANGFFTWMSFNFRCIFIFIPPQQFLSRLPFATQNRFFQPNADSTLFLQASTYFFFCYLIVCLSLSLFPTIFVLWFLLDYFIIFFFVFASLFSLFLFRPFKFFYAFPLFISSFFHFVTHSVFPLFLLVFFSRHAIQVSLFSNPLFVSVCFCFFLIVLLIRPSFSFFSFTLISFFFFLLMDLFTLLKSLFRLYLFFLAYFSSVCSILFCIWFFFHKFQCFFNIWSM